MINKVILVGRITRDPEIRYTSNGTPTVSFSVAVDRSYTSQNGDRQADFINCVAWRQQAEFISRYIKKGYMIDIEGRIQTRNYQNQQGQTVYVTEVLVEQVSNLQPRDNNSLGQSYNQQNNNYRNNNNQGYQQNNFNNNSSYNQNQDDSSLDLNVADDDLPF